MALLSTNGLTFRLKLRPMFRDFDVPQRGLVSQNQFLRTLDSAGLRNCISPEEMEELLRKFGVSKKFLAGDGAGNFVFSFNLGNQWKQKGGAIHGFL